MNFSHILKVASIDRLGVLKQLIQMVGHWLAASYFFYQAESVAIGTVLMEKKSGYIKLARHFRFTLWMKVKLKRTQSELKTNRR